MARTSNPQLQPRQLLQLFCLHRETHYRSQPLALVFLLFAPLSLLFDKYLSDFVFGVQLVFFLLQALLVFYLFQAL